MAALQSETGALRSKPAQRSPPPQKKTQKDRVKNGGAKKEGGAASENRGLVPGGNVLCARRPLLPTGSPLLPRRRKPAEGVRSGTARSRYRGRRSRYSHVGSQAAVTSHKGGGHVTHGIGHGAGSRSVPA
eukprot:3495287-Rhodomonas_salina.1